MPEQDNSISENAPGREQIAPLKPFILDLQKAPEATQDPALNLIVDSTFKGLNAFVNLAIKPNPDSSQIATLLEIAQKSYGVSKLRPREDPDLAEAVSSLQTTLGNLEEEKEPKQAPEIVTIDISDPNKLALIKERTTKVLHDLKNTVNALRIAESPKSANEAAELLHSDIEAMPKFLLEQFDHTRIKLSTLKSIFSMNMRPYFQSSGITLVVPENESSGSNNEIICDSQFLAVLAQNLATNEVKVYERKPDGIVFLKMDERVDEQTGQKSAVMIINDYGGGFAKGTNLEGKKTGYSNNAESSGKGVRPMIPIIKNEFGGNISSKTVSYGRALKGAHIEISFPIAGEM